MFSPKNEVLVLDGATGTVLESMGLKNVWSAVEHESLRGPIQEVYTQYLEAGANVVTTPTYQTVPRGPSASKVRHQIIDTVSNAKQILGRFNGIRMVAGSVGPFGALIKAEYTGNYEVDREELHDLHCSRFEAMEAAQPDLVLAETIPNAEEVAVVLEAAETLSMPLWLSFSMQDRTLADGTSLSELVGFDWTAVECVGANCFHPKRASQVIDALQVFHKPLVLYPTIGKVFDKDKWVQPESPFDYSIVKDWYNGGVRVFGGCCGSGPEDTAKMATAVSKLMY